MRRSPGAVLGKPAPAGLRLLREAIAAHVVAARGVRCDWRQVVVTSGTQQSLDLAARTLLDRGDAVWMEDPGYSGARAAFEGAGARLVPVPVDAEGMDVAAAAAADPAARMAYVCPSHQFPLGATLSLQRRLALLRWAAANDAWIFEDDYDSEFRVSGRPLVALQGLDEHGRVLYCATFNKALFPGLRMGYCVLPGAIADDFAAARAAVDGGPGTLQQAVLADFIVDGHLAGHVRRMRQLYRERRDAFLAACRAHLAGLATPGEANTGLQTVLWLPPGVDDADISRRAREAGVDAPPVSLYRIRPGGAPGLLLTYGGEPPERIDAGIRVLASLLERARA
jgi:GntR family transcriptional regulator/MocR family aminotransferase